jgi:hypothetical protein
LHLFESPVDVLYDGLLLGVELWRNCINLCLIMLVFLFSAKMVDLVLLRAIVFSGTILKSLKEVFFFKFLTIALSLSLNRGVVYLTLDE